MSLRKGVLLCLFVTGVSWIVFAAPFKDRPPFAGPSAPDGLDRAIRALKRDKIDGDWMHIVIERNSKNTGWAITFSKEPDNVLTDWLVVVDDVSGAANVISPR